MEKEKPIIISDKRTIAELWLSLAMEAQKGKHKMTLHFLDKNSNHAARLIELLKPFGWYKIDNGRTTSINTACAYKNPEGKCTHPSTEIKVQSRCIEPIRVGCKGYIAKYKTPLIVNWVIIEQAPSIRDLY